MKTNSGSSKCLAISAACATWNWFQTRNPILMAYAPRPCREARLRMSGSCRATRWLEVVLHLRNDLREHHVQVRAEHGSEIVVCAPGSDHLPRESRDHPDFGNARAQDVQDSGGPEQFAQAVTKRSEIVEAGGPREVVKPAVIGGGVEGRKYRQRKAASDSMRQVEAGGQRIRDGVGKGRASLADRQ